MVERLAWLPVETLIGGRDLLNRLFAYIPGTHPHATKRNALVLLVYLLGLLVVTDLLVSLL